MEFNTLLIHWEWKGIVLLTLSACFLWSMRRRSARQRHLFLFSALLSLLLIPVAHRWFSNTTSSRFQIILPSGWEQVEDTFQIGVDTLRYRNTTDHVQRDDDSAMVNGNTNIEPNTGNAPYSVFRISDLRWDIFWGIGVILLMIRLGWQHLQLARLILISPEIEDDRLKRLLEQTVLDVRLGSTPNMIETTMLEVPATWGWFRPVICLPAGASSWSSEILKTVLEHECSHIKRRDFLCLHIAKMIRALTWCNPLSWWAIRRLRNDMELACDEQIIARGTSPSQYAQTLLNMTQLTSRIPSISAIPMASKSNIQSRIEAVVAKDQGADTRRIRKECVYIAGVAMLALFIGCQGSSPKQTMANDSNTQSQLPMYENFSIDAWFFPEFVRQEDELNHWPEVPPREVHAFRAFGVKGVAYLIERLEGKPLERIIKLESVPEGVRERLRERARKQQETTKRHTAARLLGDLGKDATEAIPYLEEAANDEDWLLRVGAKVALMKIRNEPIDPLIDELSATLGHQHWNRTAIMVGQFGSQAEKAIPILLDMLEKPETMDALAIDAHAIDALGMIAGQPEKCVPAIAEFLKHPSRACRQKAITALMSFAEHNQLVLPALQSATKDKDGLVSSRAKWIIGMLEKGNAE